MTNPRLELLTDYPFQRLRDLLDPIAPPVDLPPIVMSIGEPQHQPPAIIAEQLNATAGEWGKYPPIPGTKAFREAIAGWLTRRYGLAADFIDVNRHVLPLAGTREGLYLIDSVLVAGTDAAAPPVVLLPNPFYQVYVGAAVMAGAAPEFMPTTAQTGFQPDLDALDPAVLDRAAALLLCTPGNPQGAVADLDYLIRAVQLARRHDFVLMVDECYAEIYDQSPPPGALQACAALGTGLKNVLVFHSLSKRSSAAGLRSGFVAGDPDLIAAFLHLRTYGGASIGLPIQAASTALWNDDGHAIVNRQKYRQKMAAAEVILGHLPGFRRPAGGFFLWLDVGDGEAAAKRLWQDAAVRVLPGAYLARPDATGVNPGTAYIRIALVHEIETVTNALHRIANVLR